MFWKNAAAMVMNIQRCMRRGTFDQGRNELGASDTVKGQELGKEAV